MDNGNEPAFAAGTSNGVDMCWTDGLTKRELIAAMAMQGLCEGGELTLEAAALWADVAVEYYEFEEHWPIAVANMSVAHADALLAALDTGNE